jgi:hypothetical protein
MQKSLFMPACIFLAGAFADYDQMMYWRPFVKRFVGRVEVESARNVRPNPHLPHFPNPHDL